MNLLLWRSQQERSKIGGDVPTEVVWQKILTAPEKSSLEISHHGKKIGFCRWLPNVGVSPIVFGQVSSDDYQPDGMIAAPTSYSLDLEGNAAFGNTTNRLRFDCQISFSTNQNWQDFHLRASLRPSTWELHAKAADEKLHVSIEDEAGRWQKTFKSSDLKNPEALFEEFGGSSGLGLLLGGFDPPTQKNAFTRLTSGLQWTARNDWMKFGHSQVKVFRLEARLLGQYKIYVFVSRVGEILWVELPDKIILSNDDFSHF